jgi:hypothetical protein
MYLLPHSAPRPPRRAAPGFAALAGPLAGVLAGAAGLMILVSACVSGTAFRFPPGGDGVHGHGLRQ